MATRTLSERRRPTHDMSEFVHLHVHTHYSLLDSTVKVPDLVQAVANEGMNAVAMTDHCRMFGAIELQDKTKGSEVKPIYGVALQVEARVGEGVAAKASHQLVLLAENLVGYQNLLRIVSLSWLNGERDGELPITTWGLIEENREGLIALSGDLGGEVATWLLRRDNERAERFVQEMVGIFGAGNFYLEIQRNEGMPEQNEACEAIIHLARAQNVPLVATNNVHYLAAGDHEAHGILMCIGMEKRVDREILEKIPLRDLYLRSPDEMAELFEDVPDAIANTVRIAERCNVAIPTGEYFLPEFAIPEGFTIESYFRDRARAGLQERFAEMDAVNFHYDAAEYEARLDEELGIIIGMGFPGYFLIVWDFIRWAREHSIPVGPGRGSGAGSLVAWSLRITDVNPVEYGLLFERFLNPERVSMPDFDIDFCPRRRHEVIDYVTEHYGAHNVGMIVTFGQLKPRAVIKDVARVLNFSFAESDRFTKLLPEGPAAAKARLKDTYAGEPRFKELVDQDDRSRYLYESALRLEGNYRNTGIHAAGVVIAQKELWNHVPVIVGPSGELVTQYAKDEVEKAGLVKFDFLGLKNLTVIQDAIDIIDRSKLLDEPFDFNKVDLQDPEVYRLIQAGDTAGVFQMESEGFQRLVRRLRPDSFHDLVAAVALYRPGPLGSGMVDTYIDCKHGKEPEYPHPMLEPILKETFGVMVYQEQVMQAARTLAGYTLGGADMLRRAMGKKKESEMKRHRELFVEGAAKNEISAEKANEIFDLMSHFAGYGFNKSHSVAYALIAFQTAYLKAHFPAAFYAALMTNDAANAEKVSRYIVDARSRGLEVLPPDVNASSHSFTVVGNAIRFGLSAIKGVGSAPIEAIVEEREEEPFETLFDFCERIPSKRVGKRTIEALIRAGAFDSLSAEAAAERSTFEIGRWRARLFAGLDAAVERGQRAQEDRESGQSSLFDMFSQAAPEQEDTVLPDVPGWTDKVVLSGEKELLGVYVSGHPLDRYRGDIQLFSDTTSARFETCDNRQQVRMAGIITDYQERPLRNGNGKMAFFSLEDHYGSTQAIVYSSKIDDVRDDLTPDEPVIVTGTVRIDNFNDERSCKLAVESVEPLWKARVQSVKSATVLLEAQDVCQRQVDALQELFARHPGSCAVKIEVAFELSRLRVKLPEATGIRVSDEFLSEIDSVIGPQRVRLQ